MWESCTADVANSSPYTVFFGQDMLAGGARLSTEPPLVYGHADGGYNTTWKCCSAKTDDVEKHQVTWPPSFTDGLPIWPVGFTSHDPPSE